MLSELSKTDIGRFRIVAFMEGCSYLMLAFTMILKYQYQMPLPNYIVGMAHGILFILYIVLLLRVWHAYKWSFFTVVVSFLASLIPFGTFYADKRIFSKETR